MKIFILVFLLGCYAVSAKTKKCFELDKIKFEATEFCQSYIFNVYMSDTLNDTCTQFYYFGGRNGDPNQATVLFQSENDERSYPAIATESADKYHCTVVTEEKNPVTLNYYKLIVSKKYHYFCMYACDDKGDYIKTMKCLALDDAGHKKMKADLNKFKNLPFENKNTKMVDVYKCKSDPRPGGYRMGSGSADKTSCDFNFSDLFGGFGQK